MARQGKKSTTSTDQTVEAPVTEEVPTETTDEATDSTVEQDVAAKATTPADLTAFKAAVEAELPKRDEDTGKLPEESHKAINEEYRKIDGLPGKNAARKFLDDSMLEAIKGKDINLAQGYVDIKDNLSAGSGGGGAKVPTDPTEAFVARVAAFRLAEGFLLGNVPEDVKDGWEESVDSKVTEMQESFDAFAAWKQSGDEDADEPSVGTIVRQAWKLANVKGGGGSGKVSDGPRGNTLDHLNEVFADVEVGDFLKIQEIAKRKTAAYPNGDVSPGAISARLFPKGKPRFEKGGIKADEQDSKKGATKVAAE